MPDISSLLIREKYALNIGKIADIMNFFAPPYLKVSKQLVEKDKPENNFEKFSSYFCSISIEHLKNIKRKLQERLNSLSL